MRTLLAPIVVSSVLLAPSLAWTDPILPAPGASGIDADVAAKAAGYQRQQDLFATLENGLSLDIAFKPDAVAQVRAFFAQSATDDFAQFTGRAVYDAVASFEEWGDEGNFAGVAAVGVAERLLVLRSGGADPAEIARARDAAVRAARAWHVFGAIGGPGVVARGVRRVQPWQPADLPFPGTVPMTVPLRDGSGAPLPAKKDGVWRMPVAPGFDGWIWMDDTSKDQVIGYTAAVTWLWDALHDDPLVPPDVPGSLAADITLFAKELMKVAPESGVDLCIRDADGRLTDFYDLNPRTVVPGLTLPPTTKGFNGFNAAMGLAVIRAAYHVGGDAQVGRYYYDELVGRRDVPGAALKNAGIIFMGSETNFSNVNMLAIALAVLGRTESDPRVRGTLGAILQSQFWSTGDKHDGVHSKQAWYDAVYGAYGPAAPADLGDRLREELSGFQGAPAFERDRVNCDAAELAAGSCVGIDGQTVIQLDAGHGHGGVPVATVPLPGALRPDSDFQWRSNPFEVNGSGNTLMDPGGDFLAAYWMARGSDTDPTRNLSPAARPPLPYATADGGAGDGGPVMAASSCSCRIGGGAQQPPWGPAAVLLAAALATRRRRGRRSR